MQWSSGADGSLGHGVYGLYEDGKGSLWAGGIKGFWRWRPGPTKFYPMPEENTIQSFDENNNGTLMIGTRNGIAQMAGGKPEPYPLPGIAEKFFAYTMLRDREGGLWIGTRGALCTYTREGPMCSGRLTASLAIRSRLSLRIARAIFGRLPWVDSTVFASMQWLPFPGAKACRV